MNLLTLGTLRGGQLPAKVNLCKDDPRFTDLVNRTQDWILALGDWFPTTREVRLCVTDGCFVLPGCVATIKAARACNRARQLVNNFWQWLPEFNPRPWEGCGIAFAYKDQVPTARALCSEVILRVFASSARDYGKHIKFLGYDANRVWIRSLQGGIMQDGEVVTLAAPFVDTITSWTSVTAVIKDETDSAVRVFSHPTVNDTLTPIAVYEYWETAPSWQRWKVLNWAALGNPGCCPKDVIEAQVKLEHVAVQNDDDLLVVANRVAMEMAVMGVKAMDDGDLARADVLLFGNKDNERLGAVPLLQNDLRNRTDDRFSGNVQVHGTANFNRVMCGFI